MARVFIELAVKPDRRLVVALDFISGIFTFEGIGCDTIAPPDKPLTIMLNSGESYDVYGVSVTALMVALQAHGKAEGWLPLPT